MGDSEDEADVFSPDLFLNLDYSTDVLHFDDITQVLNTSHASSVLWPIAIYLAWFVVRNRGEFVGKNAVELGSGTGLSGLVASQFTASCCLTDGNEIVLELLRQNVELQELSGCLDLGREGEGGDGTKEPQKDQQRPPHLRRKRRLGASRLLWGNKQDFERYIEEWGPPDVLLGADVVCWPSFVRPFCVTVKALLQAGDGVTKCGGGGGGGGGDSTAPLDDDETEESTPPPIPPVPVVPVVAKAKTVMYLGYVERANTTTALLYATARELGIAIRSIGPEDFLPEFLDLETRPANVYSSYTLNMLELRMDYVSSSGDCVSPSGGPNQTPTQAQAQAEGTVETAAEVGTAGTAAGPSDCESHSSSSVRGGDEDGGDGGASSSFGCSGPSLDGEEERGSGSRPESGSGSGSGPGPGSGPGSGSGSGSEPGPGSRSRSGSGSEPGPGSGSPESALAAVPGGVCACACACRAVPGLQEVRWLDSEEGFSWEAPC